MRYFRSFPPLMRVVSILGILFLVASVVLSLLWYNLPPPTTLPLTVFMSSAYIALNLLILGFACFDVVIAFIIRQRQPSRRRLISLDSWQSQAQAIALMVVASLCGLIINLASALLSVFTVTNIVVFSVTIMWVVIANLPLALL